ncbi:uncharacterized protein K452DRAFT_170832 [Aplosporella prunicola CBS 121167]|uniref:Uncharacterized protein n=1 Tax=Aplosporella prunicola CBS 121167 TaxID=1176127 RepID=A0A6A6BKN6_9PEZI|nr:uncharacterized protein K452DRAFT_170832 [Aplosporella prunicola CBS 121167]KAF2143417.1 hypothetical protein K452DRAFT_170832 [Aplosporella prunicola CBS 121167]
MGQRHNRRRTRSRPRNHDAQDTFKSARARSLLLYTPTTVSYSTRPEPSSGLLPEYQSRFDCPPATTGHPPSSPWPARMQQETLRLFGGEIGDEASLCAPMLKVVMDLFDDIDYVDP